MTQNGLTKLLEAWSDGKQEALDELLPLVSAELKKWQITFLHHAKK